MDAALSKQNTPQMKSKFLKENEEMHCSPSDTQDSSSQPNLQFLQYKKNIQSRKKIAMKFKKTLNGDQRISWVLETVLQSRSRSS